MKFNELGDTGVELSAIGLGGHEYFEGGVRGFNPDEREEAVTPGLNLDGYGGERRLEVVRTALERGINFFDVTIDEEKDALGRNLETIAPRETIYVQTRPAGMVYTYGNHNEGLTEYDRLEAEVERVLGLLKRDSVELLNFGFEPGALEHNDEFFERVGENVDRLKEAGLIRFACADAQRADQYVAAIDSGAFDSISIGFHMATPEYTEDVLPAAKSENVGVITRAVFMKGALFKMADQAGIDDLDSVARASIRWCLDHDAVTSVIVGVDTADQLDRNLAAVESDGVTDADEAILDRLRATEAYRERVH
ncbi:aldo/keto reductase [Haloarchaeobius sp. TZWSO28]|uniref:aldo/keto reductase n=1 Tax=Haloarchaeobius sp. TZWSO28 TaxID=3446119 RepID=UPI003EB9C1F3